MFSSHLLRCNDCDVIERSILTLAQLAEKRALEAERAFDAQKDLHDVNVVTAESDAATGSCEMAPAERFAGTFDGLANANNAVERVQVR